MAFTDRSKTALDGCGHRLDAEFHSAIDRDPTECDQVVTLAHQSVTDQEFRKAVLTRFDLKEDVESIVDAYHQWRVQLEVYLKIYLFEFYFENHTQVLDYKNQLLEELVSTRYTDRSKAIRSIEANSVGLYRSRGEASLPPKPPYSKYSHNPTKPLKPKTWGLHPPKPPKPKNRRLHPPPKNMYIKTLGYLE